MVLVGALIAFSPQPSTATLVVTAGQVTVQTASHPEQIVTAGQVLNVKTGDSLTVKPGAEAQLRFYDGSSVDLSENTQIEVQELATSDDQFRVRLKMLTGRTVSRVLRLLGVGDAFEISTPSSTVSVRGTVFIVQVLDANTTYVGCDKRRCQGGQRQPAGRSDSRSAVDRQPRPAAEDPAAAERRNLLPTENGGQNVPPTGETDLLTTAICQPSACEQYFHAASAYPEHASRRPCRRLHESLAPNEARSTPGAPAVTSGSSGPKGTPNKPSQVPGKPPSVVPGNGNPPSGGGEPPGKGGEPPGQTKDKGNKGKNK